MRSCCGQIWSVVGVAQGRTGMDAALLSTAVLRGQAFKLRVIDHNNLFSDVVIDHRTVVESARGEGGKGEGGGPNAREHVPPSIYHVSAPP